MTSDGGEKASIVHIHVLGRSLSGTMLPNHDAGWLTDRGPRLNLQSKADVVHRPGPGACPAANACRASKRCGLAQTIGAPRYARLASFWCYWQRCRKLPEHSLQPLLQDPADAVPEPLPLQPSLLQVTNLLAPDLNC